MRRVKLYNTISKKNVARAISLAMAAMVLTSSAFSYQGTLQNVQAAQSEENEQALEDTLKDQINVSSQEDSDKEETVYVFADANGNTNHILVSDWLKNKNGSATIEDSSELKDIVNVKGDEGFKQDGDKLVWEANGEDIYYQGTTTKQAPVDVKITYFLDGKEIAPDQLAGKSGDVKIRFDYTNNEEKEVEINGKKETIKVPFVVLSGMVLNNEDFKNIEVKNGRVVSEGNNTIVAGIAIPGLKDSLKIDDTDLDKGDLEIPEYVEVEAQVTNFSMDMTMSVVLSNMLDQIKTDDINTDDLKNDMDELADGTQKLVDGSKELKDGTGTLREKVGEFNDGLKTLDKGISDYTDGAGQIKEGTTQLSDGTQKLADAVPQLKDGVKQLKDGSSTAKSGADKLVAGYAGDGTDKNPGAAKGMKALAKGAKQLSSGSVTLKQGTESAIVGVDKLKAGVDVLASGYTGDGTVENPGAAAGIKSLSDGAKQLNSEVSKLDLSGLANAKPTEEETAAVSAAVSQSVTAALGTAENQAAIAKAASDGANAAVAAANGDATAEQIAAATKTSADEAASQAYTQYKAALSAKGITEEQLKAVIAAGIVASQGGTVSGNELTALQANAAAQAEAMVNGIFNGSSSAMTSLAEGVASSASEKTTEMVNTAVSGAAKSVAATAAGIAGETAANTASQATMGAVQQKVAAYGTKVEELKKGVAQIDAGATALNKGINGYDDKDGHHLGLAEGTTQVQTGLVDLQSGTKQLDNGAGQIKDGLATLNTGADSLNKGINGYTDKNGKKVIGLYEGTKTLAKGLNKLDTGVGTLNTKSGELASGVSALNVGAKKLDDGAGTLVGNSPKLKDGSNKLVDAGNQLADGVAKLDDGAGELSDGILKLDDEGIKKLTDAFEGDLSDLLDRISAIQDAGKEYNNFSGVAEGKSSSVKFIIKTDGITKDEE